MINRVIIILFVIGMVGLTAFDFNKTEASCNSNSFLEGDTLNKQTATTSDFLDLKFTEVIRPPLNQDLFFFVKGRYDRSTTKKVLQHANSINDVIPSYPSTWIKDYRSVEITSTCNNKIIKAISEDNILNEEQKAIFNDAEMTSKIQIKVNYKSKNIVNDKVQDRQMNVLFTVIPEVEAEYIGGYEQMITYFTLNSEDKISAQSFKELMPSSILFIVNKEGGINEVEINKTSGNEEVDEILMELVRKMPTWKPAENAKGIKVEQQFEFLLGMDGC